MPLCQALPGGEVSLSSVPHHHHRNHIEGRLGVTPAQKATQDEGPRKALFHLDQCQSIGYFPRSSASAHSSLLTLHFQLLQMSTFSRISLLYSLLPFLPPLQHIWCELLASLIALIILPNSFPNHPKLSFGVAIVPSSPTPEDMTSFNSCLSDVK